VTEVPYPENLTLRELTIDATDPIQKERRDIANAEIARRTAQAQIDSAEAQRQSVESGKWSVIVMAFIAGLSALFQLLSWLWPNPLTH